MPTRRLLPTLALATVTALACGNDQIVGGGVTPSSAQFVVAGSAPSGTLTLAPGQTARVAVQFKNADGDIIPGLESQYFASLTFSPTTLATVTPVPGEPFQFNVKAQITTGSGTVTVGFGVDAFADDDSFGPYPFNVQ